MKHILLLGSQSQSRQSLLRDAEIPFIVAPQDADETACDWGLTLPQLTGAIARQKMEHVIMPPGQEGQVAFVLTADTLTLDRHGNVHGKTTDREDLRSKITLMREYGGQ